MKCKIILVLTAPLFFNVSCQTQSQSCACKPSSSAPTCTKTCPKPESVCKAAEVKPVVAPIVVKAPTPNVIVKPAPTVVVETPRPQVTVQPAPQPQVVVQSPQPQIIPAPVVVTAPQSQAVVVTNNFHPARRPITREMSVHDAMVVLVDLVDVDLANSSLAGVSRDIAMSLRDGYTAVQAGRVNEAQRKAVQDQIDRFVAGRQVICAEKLRAALASCVSSP